MEIFWRRNEGRDSLIWGVILEGTFLGQWVEYLSDPKAVMREERARLGTWEEGGKVGLTDRLAFEANRRVKTWLIIKDAIIRELPVRGSLWGQELRATVVATNQVDRFPVANETSHLAFYLQNVLSPFVWWYYNKAVRCIGVGACAPLWCNELYRLAYLKPMIQPSLKGQWMGP